MKKYVKMCLAVALLMGAPLYTQAQGNDDFLLPGEFVVAEDSADVTGDMIDDRICLIGTGNQQSGFASNMNLIVEDGLTKEISRSLLNKASGYRGSLVIGDFNGDSIKDVMFLTQRADMKMFAYVVAFNKTEPKVIYQPEADAPEVRSGEVVITASDNQKVILVQKESMIQLRLPENPTTGYTWQFTQSTGGECVTFLGQQNLVPEHTPEMVGKPGLAVFSFRAQQQGVLEMTMSNFRLWEGPDSKIDTFKVTIKVVD